MEKILVTGTAGFIGFHVAKKLLSLGYEVTGIDSINDYYDTALKLARLNDCGIRKDLIQPGKVIQSEIFTNYRFIQTQLEDKAFIDKLFSESQFDVVINLAAQAGVRYSIQNPYAYLNSNLLGFLNLLEASRHNNIRHLIYASTSSVYGLNEKFPLAENEAANHPMTLYAATKKSNEMMAHSYSHLFNLPTTGLRFFTVYGPWGRPDMALFLFTNAIIKGEPIRLFNNGNMIRDFTFVGDIVESIARLVPLPPQRDASWSGLQPNPATSSAPYRILNIGNSKPVPLIEYVEALEKALGTKAKRELLPMQLGDVPATQADCSMLENITGYRPQVEVEQGVAEFVKWYKQYFGL
ncbi:MAG: NAD-dependent epimerase [Sphingobacteriales bacterium]|nr:NAD-dependent epimerase [Sphingobacteriales bacterium]MBI3717964.1 NAD-dependent epimerase [Sphingobacteriales bacterium]